MSNLTLDEAKSMVNADAIDKLKQMVNPKPLLNFDQKVNNDIIMSALCRAVADDVIKMKSLDERLIKLLNSSTNTLSATKVSDILVHLRKTQPNMCCVITLMTADMNTTINEWVFIGNDVYFNDIFEFVIDYFKITPSMVRQKMTTMLKTTIVNNVAQLISRYRSLNTVEEKRTLNISINTVTRLVNMSEALLMAEFKEEN